MARPPKELVDAICESLRERPEEWRTGWIAQHFRSGTIVFDYSSPKTVSVKADGVVYGGFHRLGWLSPWRLRLFFAVRACAEARRRKRAEIDAAACAVADHTFTLATLRGAS